MENTENSSAPAPSSSGAGGKEKIEKQARQLAYDTRYKVKQAMAAKSGSKLDPAAVRKAYAAQLGKSPASPPVKARAKEMLLGEDLVDINKLVADNAASALFKVFVEGIKEQEEVIEEDTGEKTYKVRVTDKKTGNSYVRNATRAKITELRANPNISSVEMTEYGEPTKSEKHKGTNTAAVKSGKSDEVSGKDDKIDLKKENYSWKNGFAELIEKKKSEDKKTVTGEGVNNAKLIKVFPDETVKEDAENVTEVLGLVKKAVKLPGEIAKTPGKIAGAVAGNIPVVGGAVKAAVQLPGKIASVPGKVAAGIIPGGKKNANEQYSNWREETEDVNEVVGSIVGGALGRGVLPGLIAKTGAKAAIGKVAGEKVASALTGKVAGTAIGAAAGEMIDPLKKKKSPVGAAAGGAVAGLVASSNELEGEVVSELTNTTLLGYTQKATNQLAFRGDGSKTAQKRAKGVKKATARLAIRASDPDGSMGFNKNPKNEGNEIEGKELSENPVQKAWNWFVPSPENSANPNVRSGKLKPGKLEGPILDKMNKGAETVNAPIKATSQAVKSVQSIDLGKVASKAALPVAAGLAAKAVVDKVTGKKEKDVKEDANQENQEAPTPGSVTFDGGAALPATINPIGDPRELATTINLIKNKWRAKGLKMSYEPEGDKINEGLGTALGGAIGGVGGAAVTGAVVGSKDKSKKDKGRVKKAAGAGIGALVGKAILPGPAGAALGGYVGGKLSNSHVPEGELTEEFINESVDHAVNYFSKAGLNEYGLERVIEEVGVEDFTEFVFGLTNQLNEERSATKAKPRDYAKVKASVDAKDAKKKAEGKGEYSKSAASKRNYGDEVAPEGKPEKKVEKAVSKAKKTQPAAPISKPGLADRVRGAVKKGIERHNKAREAGRVPEKRAKEFGKGVASGVKTAVKVAKDVKKAVVGESQELPANIVNALGRLEAKRERQGTKKSGKKLHPNQGKWIGPPPQKKDVVGEEVGQVNRADIIGGTPAAKNAQSGKGKYTPGKGVTKNFQLDPKFERESFSSEKDTIKGILEGEGHGVNMKALASHKEGLRGQHPDDDNKANAIRRKSIKDREERIQQSQSKRWNPKTKKVEDNKGRYPKHPDHDKEQD